MASPRSLAVALALVVAAPAAARPRTGTAVVDHPAATRQQPSSVAGRAQGALLAPTAPNGLADRRRNQAGPLGLFSALLTWSWAWFAAEESKETRAEHAASAVRAASRDAPRADRRENEKRKQRDRQPGEHWFD